ncbi:MAG: hypothetical protein ORN98_03455 [Alphaproteobacteria bacterium]|nr:hypothetical protein [Alphaproteobacteria bacterium]
MADKPIQRIAVYSDGENLRNALANLPFIRALRYHFGGCTIDWLSRQESVYHAPILSPLLTGMLDRIEILGERQALPLKLLLPQRDREKYDVLIDTSTGKFMPWLLAHLVGAGGQAINVHKNNLPINPHPHRAGKLISVVQYLIGGAAPETRLRFQFKPDVLDVAARILRPGYHYLALAPGGSARTIWPLENYVAVAQGVAANGHVPVFLLGPEESAWQPKLLALVPTALFPLQHPYARVFGFRFDFTIAVLERCHIGLASDNLASELIAAADIPLLSLFGPTDPIVNAPWTQKGLVLEAKQFGGTEMQRIPPVNVLHALAQARP